VRVTGQLTDAERGVIRDYLAGDLPVNGDRAFQRAYRTLTAGLDQLHPPLLAVAAEAGVTASDQTTRARGIAAVAGARYALAHPYPDTVTAAVCAAVQTGPWIPAQMVEVLADELRMALPDQPATTAVHWRRLLAWCDERLGREQLDHEDATRGPRRRRQEVPA
jgi:hypothetical protein